MQPAHIHTRIHTPDRHVPHNHTCVHAHTHTCLHAHTHTHMHTLTHPHTHASTHARTQTHTHTHSPTHMHAHTCSHARKHTHIHTTYLFILLLFTVYNVADAHNMCCSPILRESVDRLQRPTTSSQAKVEPALHKRMNVLHYTEQDSYCWDKMPIFTDIKKCIWTQDGSIKRSTKL